MAKGVFLHRADSIYDDLPEERYQFPKRYLKAARQTIGGRCALTGFRFINGGGRAEAEAAHIKPVAANGPDSIRNGIALSGTVHWMFDRGLLSLDDDYSILISRHINDQDHVRNLLVPSRKAILPADKTDWPHASFLTWHRDVVFKV